MSNISNEGSGINSKEIFSKNLKRYMQEKRINIADLARKMNLPFMTVSSWYHGRNYPRIDKIERLAQLFGISKSDLIEDHDQSAVPKNAFVPDDKFVKIPFYGSVSAGLGAFAGGYPPESYKSFPVSEISKYERYFCLRVDGDSMEPVLMDGDIVLVRCQPVVESGEIGVAVIDGERGLVKKIYLTKGSISLVPSNRAYDPETYVGQETSRVRICGKVVSMKREF